MSELKILLYHGVTMSPSRGIENYSGKHIAANEFIAQMRYLSRHCRVLTMDEVVEHYRHRRPFPEQAVAITFDDGFRNNATVAAPILSRYRLPATFYLSTGILGGERLFWVDEIEDCINRTDKPRISLALLDAEFNLQNAEDRRQAVDAIKRRCKRLPAEVKARVIDELRRISGVVPSATAVENYRSMSWDEVRMLDAEPFFTIGGHAHNHEILSMLEPVKMTREIDLSLDLLRAELGHEVHHYSYPEGQAEHFNAEVIAVLRQRGIICCPSAIDGVNTGDEDLFTLKRIMVGFAGRPFPFAGYGENRLQSSRCENEAENTRE